MHLSVSSILVSLIVASLLVGLLQILVARNRAYGVFRIDFIVAFALIVLVRLLFPCEYIDTHTFSSHVILPAIYKFLAQPRFTIGHSQVTLFILVGVIWLAGTLWSLTRLLWQGLQLSHTLSHLPRVDTDSLLLSDPISIPPAVTVYQLAGVASPFVFGLHHPKLILPAIDLAPAPLTHVMHHELQHIRNHDVLIKYLVSLLVCVYWWFIPVYLFRRQVNIIIEMRVDNQIVRGVSKSEYFGYTESLVSVAKSLQTATPTPVTPALSAALLPQFTMFERPTLRHRIQFLLTGRTVKRTNRVLLGLIVIVPLLATSIIFEPDSIDPKDAQGTFELDTKSSKIIEHNHKYHLWMEGHDVGEISHPHSKAFQGIPIIKR